MYAAVLVRGAAFSIASVLAGARAMDIDEALTKLATDASVDQKTRIERYMALLQELLAKAAAPAIKAFVGHVTSEDCALVVSRQVLLDLAAGLPALAEDALKKEVGTFALEKIQPRVTSFEEQASTIREHLASMYEREEEWAEAAKMLAGIPMDSGIRMIETACSNAKQALEEKARLEERKQSLQRNSKQGPKAVDVEVPWVDGSARATCVMS